MVQWHKRRTKEPSIRAPRITIIISCSILRVYKGVYLMKTYCEPRFS
nr:MAG TPA: hypothetical protein [Bacteriophage sp.]DAR94021.1 MAG TPA: hypothetical protein [Caudoviricetes sp.]DAS95014.1 MAG TPA: hypothetical protein [Caudoviricetes sp.]DAY37513.1 MAG TPA: hypothetical protein [Caudoviricetes sp.]